MAASISPIFTVQGDAVARFEALDLRQLAHQLFHGVEPGEERGQVVGRCGSGLRLSTDELFQRFEPLA